MKSVKPHRRSNLPFTDTKKFNKRMISNIETITEKENHNTVNTRIKSKLPSYNENVRTQRRQKEELSDIRESQEDIILLLQENNLLKAEKERYKKEYSKLMNQLANQINTLTMKLENAENKLEEKCCKTKEYINKAIFIIGFLIKENNEIEIKNQLIEINNLLHKSLGLGNYSKEYKEIGVQAINDLVPEVRIAGMKQAVESMKEQMKELEEIYEAEISKTINEKEQYKTEVISLKQEIVELKAKVKYRKNRYSSENMQSDSTSKTLGGKKGDENLEEFLEDKSLVIQMSTPNSKGNVT